MVTKRDCGARSLRPARSTIYIGQHAVRVERGRLCKPVSIFASTPTQAPDAAPIAQELFGRLHDQPMQFPAALISDQRGVR